MKLPAHLFVATAVATAALLSLPQGCHGFSASRNVPSNKETSRSSFANPSSSDSFIFRSFATECDDNNSPPTLKTISGNIQQLTTQGSDIRGRFVDHPRLGRISQASRAIAVEQQTAGGVPALTPFVAFCLGHAFAQSVLQQKNAARSGNVDDNPITTIGMGRDPRPHGTILCDAFGRGAQSADANIRVVYTGIATTPSMFHFCRAGMCDGAVMVTASHLPSDRNGFKMYTSQGGFTKHQVFAMNQMASDFAQKWHDVESGMLPPTSGGEGVFCSEWVDFMPQYANTLKDAICAEVQHGAKKQQQTENPLEGLKIVLNSGNGSGGFFNKVLQDLGADVSASVHVEHNPDFPAGIPNPEKKEMITETIQICQEAGADLGILLDTDADRSGFVVPSDETGTEFEPLTRNRLIALLSVIFSRSSPGCAVVTDSVTSEGLAKFLEDDLGLQHVRYLKGYANVIGKAQEINNKKEANAEMAIETSGHCAMKENGFLDDGTYAAVKVIGLLAREKLACQETDSNSSPDLLSLISAMNEMAEEAEIRMEATDGSLETMASAFDLAAKVIEDLCNDPSLPWTLDTENLEGIRVRTGSGGFFMLRKSLHDPLISLQVESTSKQDALKTVVAPLLEKLQSIEAISNSLDMEALRQY